MQTSVTFKNLDPSEHLRDYVTTKLNRLDKLLDNPAEAQVVLSVEKIRHITEIRLSGDRLNIACREKSNDMYSSIDLALDKLEKQLKKQKEKIKNHRPNNRGESKADDMAGTASPVAQAELSEQPRIQIESIEYKPMDVEEASMQIELVADEFIVFTNARTNQVNVLYRRKDGDLGLIQPLG
ncbi:MAG: ribosome hibernation-promoting factor, HPF/YfiA family [Thermodesulfobacteriota bacterium]